MVIKTYRSYETKGDRKAKWIKCLTRNQVIREQVPPWTLQVYLDLLLCSSKLKLKFMATLLNLLVLNFNYLLQLIAWLQ